MDDLVAISSSCSRRSSSLSRQGLLLRVLQELLLLDMVVLAANTNIIEVRRKDVLQQQCPTELVTDS